MVKVAVLVAPGFEEGETLTIVDIIRRANIECELVGIDEIVTGAHDITVKCDAVLDANLSGEYDMVVLPGGRPGADNLRDNKLVIKAINEMDAEGKWVAAMCAAPIALEQAGILENRNYTAYVGYQDFIKVGNFKEDIVVVDKNLVTSRGAATAYEFAYALVDVLGGDSIAVKKRMVYTNAFDVEEGKVYG
ncbi:TPA: DJ-1/PfpI family protein [Streptococcus suis]|nr:DJ-1/PfpI family protein [Streptococcus suis]HEM2864189.1 DJ-1/PfpI family protein [Streptococcus suis]HEM2870440.1 DJ-1/PfpI family protein [Streptococcus suis]